MLPRSGTATTVADRTAGWLREQKRVVHEDLLDAARGRELAQDRTHGHPGGPDAKQSAHLVRVDGDPLMRHAFGVREKARPGPPRQATRGRS